LHMLAEHAAGDAPAAADNEGCIGAVHVLVQIGQQGQLMEGGGAQSRRRCCCGWGGRGGR
jgi:hypothetical protein